MKPEIRWAARRATASSARRKPVSMIVIHVEEGTEVGSEATFAAANAHASAHYGIAKDGRIDQFLPLDRAAWHAGNLDVNHRSIGIELEGYVHNGAATFTEPMMAALGDLVGWLLEEYPAIECDRKHIIGHCEVPDEKHPGQFGGAGHHTDPGPAFPWDRFMADLNDDADADVGERAIS